MIRSGRTRSGKPGSPTGRSFTTAPTLQSARSAASGFPRAREWTNASVGGRGALSRDGPPGTGPSWHDGHQHDTAAARSRPPDPKPAPAAARPLPGPIVRVEGPLPITARCADFFAWSENRTKTREAPSTRGARLRMRWTVLSYVLPERSADKGFVGNERRN